MNLVIFYLTGIVLNPAWILPAFGIIWIISLVSIKRVSPVNNGKIKKWG